MSKQNLEQSGYALLIVLVFLALAGLAIAGSLSTDASGARTVHATKVRSVDYYEAEEAIGHVVSWMRLHSQKLANGFRRDEFYTEFERTAPTVGDNDNSEYTVATMIKLQGTNDSAMLINDASLGNAEFFDTRDLTTNVVFDAEDEYEDADLGSAKVRITLFDALPFDETKDYGAPPAAVPETDFYPVYLVDAMRETTEGGHVYATVTGNVIHRFDYGIYGEDYLEILQACDSYISSAGPYTSASKRANCPAASNSTSAVLKNEEVYGSLKTNGDIDPNPPFGGETCADFVAGCPNKGETCAGEDCGVPLLEQFNPWASYCPGPDPDLPVAGALTLASTPTPCWNEVIVASNSTLTLTSVSTDGPYYIKTLHLQNNSNSVLNIAPNPATGYVELYVENIVGNKFNGVQVVNGSGRPVQFRMYYLGTNALVLDGNANMNIALVAPNAPVTISGNFDFHGSVLAKELYLQGSGGIHYDEDLAGEGPIIDVQYRIKQLVQRYR